MDSTINFSKQLADAIAKKSAWFDSTQLPKTLESYRNIKGYMTSLSGVMSRKGFIKNDPYKHEKKITDLTALDDSAFIESERASCVGTRLSDYDNMLDYISSYVKFSVEGLTVDRIKKLCAFNNYISWTSFSNTSSKPTTKALAEIVNSIKNGSDNMSINMVNDILTLLAKEITAINLSLKALTDFQREEYKLLVRTKITDTKVFNPTGEAMTINAAVSKVRKMFPLALGKKPFYTELIEELVSEEFAPDKEARRAAALNRVAIQGVAQSSAETKRDDSRETLMDAVRILGGSASQLEIIINKLTENSQTLESQKKGFLHQLAVALRHAFALKQKPIEYRVTITENVTQTTRIETVNIGDFIADLTKRMRQYASISQRKNNGYQKLAVLEETRVLEYLNKQLSECQKILILLAALDSYFKSALVAPGSTPIRGLKIEISAVKGILHKANQQRAEYASIMEEREQLRKMGLKNDE